MALTSAPEVAVRLRAAPRYDPPYDDERSGELWALGSAQPLLTPTPLPAPGSRPARQPPVAAPRGRKPAPATGPAVAVAVRFVNTCLEIFNGYRPVGHFRALASPLAAASVIAEMSQALHRLRRAAGGPTGDRILIKLRQMRTCQPRPSVTEIAAVIGTAVRPQATVPARRIPDRAWAFASRLEHLHGRWLCTAARVL